MCSGIFDYFRRHLGIIVMNKIPDSANNFSGFYIKSEPKPLFILLALNK